MLVVLLRMYGCLEVDIDLIDCGNVLLIAMDLLFRNADEGAVILCELATA